MDDLTEIRDLGEGKYSFFVGVHKYTLTTPIEKERFTRIVSNMQQLVASFPRNMTQEDRLLLSLVNLMNQMDEVCMKISDITDNINSRE